MELKQSMYYNLLTGQCEIVTANKDHDFYTYAYTNSYCSLAEAFIKAVQINVAGGFVKPYLSL